MKIIYKLIQQNIKIDKNTYTTYGIEAHTIKNGKTIILDHIPDVSPNYNKTKKLVDECNKYNLLIEHFHDVIQDAIEMEDID